MKWLENLLLGAHRPKKTTKIPKGCQNLIFAPPPVSSYVWCNGGRFSIGAFINCKQNPPKLSKSAKMQFLQNCQKTSKAEFFPWICWKTLFQNEIYFLNNLKMLICLQNMWNQQKVCSWKKPYLETLMTAVCTCRTYTKRRENSKTLFYAAKVKINLT